MQKRAFLSKVVQMSATMIVFNISDICYSIYLSRNLGAESIGLFHLVMNVFSMGVSFSVSGMTLTATRLLSDMPKEKAIVHANTIVSKCIGLCLVTSGIAASVIAFFATPISVHLLKSPDSAHALRILAPALLCVGISAPLTGYFTAFGKIGAIAIGKFFSQSLLWVVTIALLKNNLCVKSFSAPVIATFFSAIAETACGVIVWRIAKLPSGIGSDGIGYRAILKLCAPIALGSFLRTGLSSGENLLIPRLMASDGLSSYGILKGMTVPVLMFPYVFMGAFTSLIVPEIAGRHTSGCKNSIRYISSLTVESTLTFAALISAIYFLWSDEICSLFFKFEKSGFYLKLLSFLPVMMFLDSSVDAILKGLDRQVFSLKVNIVDSMARIGLICILVPRFGIEGYVAVMYISEATNLTASFWMLRKVTNVKVKAYKIAAKIFSSLGIALGVTWVIPMYSSAAKIFVFTAIYIVTTQVMVKFSN